SPIARSRTSSIIAAVAAPSVTIQLGRHRQPDRTPGPARPTIDPATSTASFKSMTVTFPVILFAVGSYWKVAGNDFSADSSTSFTRNGSSIVGSGTSTVPQTCFATILSSPLMTPEDVSRLRESKSVWPSLPRSKFAVNSKDLLRSVRVPHIDDCHWV